MEVFVEVNGSPARTDVEPRSLFVLLPPDARGLSATPGGGAGSTGGARTALLDGEWVQSCVVPAVRTAGPRVTAIQGLRFDDVGVSPAHTDAAAAARDTAWP